MVRCEDDQRVLEQATLLHEGEQAAQLVVDLLDEPHVDGDDLLTHLLARKTPAGAQVHECGEDRMRIAALLLRAHDGQNVGGSEHVVVGRRRDVGPVRFDVGEMQAPRRIAGFPDEVHSAAGHVGRLGVLLAHAGGLARMAHGPARGQPVAFPCRGIGPVVPGIVAGVALVVEIAVVAGHLRIIAAIGADAVQPVVALVGVEPAFGNPHADDGAGIDAEPLHALAVGAHVRLAHQHRLHPERAQIVAERHLADLQRHAVPGRAMRLHIAPGVEAHARGSAHRRLHIGAREAHTLGRKPIDVRRGQPGVSVAGQVIPAQLVAHDEENVFAASAHRVPARQ